ncbi:MAG: hypothetical protein ACM3JJ_12260 [Hyphomicrobiales bacterium]
MTATGRPTPSIAPAAAARAIDALVAVHGAPHRAAIERGVRQVAERWWPEDGDADAFVAFCREHYVSDPAEQEAIAARAEDVLEQVQGRLSEIRRILGEPIELDRGPIRAIDALLENVNLGAHLLPDLYRTRVAFLLLLHFPVHTLAERLREGPAWDRAAWARSRLVERVAERVPAPVVQEAARVLNAAERYVAEYDLPMERIVAADGKRRFPIGLSLITHWGLRDEIKALYADGPAALERQRMIQRVLERIVRQEIPDAVRRDTRLLWCPETNAVLPSPGADPPGAEASAREPDTRYRHVLDVFHALREIDPYVPNAPSHIRRQFDLDRQIPEPEVEALLLAALDAPEGAAIGALVAGRLGRPLEAYDIWYPGLIGADRHDGGELDERVRERFPTLQAFQEGLPALLEDLGFARDRAAWLAARIVVDPARGAGHALGAAWREDQAHLRTRVPSDGMNYKGFNIALHELGHNVEQVFSLHAIDRWALHGVPNTAATEAFAFLFQERDLEMLGLREERGEARHAFALHTLWTLREIAGVSLVEMKVWNWLYAHPDATPAALRETTLGFARDVWNRHFAPIFGVRDVELLAVYSHSISSPLYLADYAIGQITMFQIAEHLTGRAFAAEVERIARIGCLTPDAWMRAAVGGPLSAAPLLAAARAALRADGGARAAAAR